MSRSHHKAESRVEHGRSFTKFLSQQDTLAISFAYVRRETDPTTAYNRLTSSGARGSLYAGEIALEQSAIPGSEERSIAWLRSAEESFNRALEMRRFAGQRVVDALTARARLQIAHLPVYTLLNLGGKLPPRRLAEQTYEQTVDIGQEAAEVVMGKVKAPDRAHRAELTGTVSELAALMLLERTALGIGSEDWFPYLSHFSEDRRNSGGSSLNHGWDISVFNVIDEDPERTFRLQVKSSNIVHKGLQRNPCEAGIALVSIDPDLRLSDGESYVTQQIIRDGFTELYYDHTDRASHSLQQRSDMLLGILDNSVELV